MADSVTYVVNAVSGGNRKSGASLSDPIGIQVYGGVATTPSSTVAGLSSRDSRLRGGIYPGTSGNAVNSKMGG